MPKKLFLALGAFALGVGAGVGLAALLEEKRKRCIECDTEGIEEPALLEIEEEEEILAENAFTDASVEESEVEEGTRVIRETLTSLALCEKCEIASVTGPSVICYQVACAPVAGALAAVRRADDFSVNLGRMARLSLSKEPGVFSVEVPRKQRVAVPYKEMKNDSAKLLEVPIGLGVDGEAVYCDLAKMPHLLVAGIIGTGKSVLTATMLMALAEKNSPADVRFVLIDPKMIEFSAFETLPHLYTPILTSARDAAAALGALVEEMERRYALMREASVRTLQRYNEKVGDNAEKRLPAIVVAVDELTDLMMSGYKGQIESFFVRLAQKSRAAGIHLILSTQRIHGVITSTLKANMPSRVSFALRSAKDSRNFLDMSGAESLMSHGDMLYMPMSEGAPLRVQCAYISNEEVQERVDALRQKMPDVTYKEDFVRRMREQSKLFAELDTADKDDRFD